MTIEAARTLDHAFSTYLAVAQHDDSSPVSRQSPSWQPLTTPYDFAAALCKSLLPYAYNYDPRMRAITEEIWVTTVEALEVLPFDNPAIKEALIDHNTHEPYTCDVCGWDVRTSHHYKECC